MSRKLIDFDDRRDLGVLRLYIPTVRLENIIRANVPLTSSSFLYTDGKGVPIVAVGDLFSGTEAGQDVREAKGGGLPGRVVIDGRPYVQGSMTSQITGWSLTYYSPLSAITRKTRLISLMTLVTTLVSVALCAALASRLSLFITRRIDVFVRKTNEISGGNLDTTLPVTGTDEIGQLARRFDAMLSRIRDLIQREYKAQMRMDRTRLQLLQEQINPHLLYNSLSTIAMIARGSSQDEIVAITENLSKFYRNSLSQGRIVVPISTEMDTIRQYTEIMKRIYRIDLTLEIGVDEVVLGLPTIKLTLQPIVENAIVHGLKPRGSGMLVVQGDRKLSVVTLSVTDDGVGMNESQLEKVRRSLTLPIEGRGYGLRNVQQRITLLFGPGFGVDVQSSPGAGTLVSVNVPALTPEEMSDRLTLDWQGRG